MADFNQWNISFKHCKENGADEMILKIFLNAY